MPTTRTTFPNKVKVIENIFIPLADGTRLAAKVWMPDAPGRFPAILEYLPYRKRDGTRTRDQGMHAYLAGHGYVCVRLDIRGSGDSDGLIDDEYTVQEQLDGVEAIAWIAAQDWCDGQVAMIGISWGGFNGLQIAARQPPALKTIITVGSTDDRYATDIHWVGGCLSKDNFDWAATMMAHNDLPPDPAIVGERWREMWQARMEHQYPWIIHWMRHQRRDDYWKQGSVCEDFSKITIPVYAVSGWADNYSESVPRLLAGLSGPRLGLVGPWAHSFPYDAAVKPDIGWLQEVLRWCDHWMKGRATGIMDEPMYRVWMQDSVPPQTCYLERPGRWVGEDSWPSPRIEMRQMSLNPHGTLGGAPGTGKAAICSPLWVGAGAGEVGRYGEDAEWAGDQREDDGGSLVFVTEPLTEAVEILGAPLIKLTFSSDKPQALVAARLNDVMPDGRSTRVGIGLLNLTHRDSHEHATALEPGKTYTATVEMDDIAHHFPAGHRIAVSLSTTYWPIAWPSPELATLTVHLGASHLVLPVRPPRAEDAALREFDPSEEAQDTPSISHPSPELHPRRVVRDLLSGKITVDFPRWTYVKEMPDISQTHASTGVARFEIIDGDPLSAVTYTDNKVEIRRPDATITHHSKGSMSCDATHFIIDMELVLHEDGKQVFAKSWHERIPREMV
ncbi:MAG: CocE/NonD family hydrolase [Limimaricola sp.]|uniref:CocE/NonD family hydrolase n=1 Tax=Limimaricola sp. TaxID=2211665 RepID=UPI001DE5F46E|nr:CocE/NonD family hydrolase [Limimaricola sp.]MBI1417871.1 CocE/NonD family hydrolase [Limimaricola sp.]